MLGDRPRPTAHYKTIVAGVSALVWRVYAHSRDNIELITELGPIDHLDKDAQNAARMAYDVDRQLGAITIRIQTEQILPLMRRVDLKLDLEHHAFGRRSKEVAAASGERYRTELARHVDVLMARRAVPTTALGGRAVRRD
jgi:hypothetical protein